jgi:Ankyrin repeat
MALILKHMTALCYACSVNRVTSANAFIAAGAKLDTVNNAGDTPLHLIASYSADSNVELIKALVVAGARLNIRNNEGKTAYDLACAAERDDDALNLLRPEANTAVTEEMATTHTGTFDPTAAAAAAAVPNTSSVSDAIENKATRQPAHTVPMTPTPASSSEANVLDTWLCKWLIEIGFAETEACTYTAALTKLKCYTATPLAKLTEVKATKLATAAGVSEYEIDMLIAGWQQLKLTHQLTISTATSQSVTPISSPPVSPAALTSTTNSRPQSPISLVTDPTLR